MSVDEGPRVVTPQEAREWLTEQTSEPWGTAERRLAHTVATEPDRIEFARAAGVVSGWADAMSTEPKRTRAAQAKAYAEGELAAWNRHRSEAERLERERDEARDNGATLRQRLRLTQEHTRQSAVELDRLAQRTRRPLARGRRSRLVSAKKKGGRIVSPREAAFALRTMRLMVTSARVRIARDYARTVASEPERTRAAVVKALRFGADHLSLCEYEPASAVMHLRADAIENGADW